jgi:hypothetical protein
MLDSLFPAAPFRSYAPERARLVKPSVAPVRFAGGSCNAACMYAEGDECTCPCGGANHRAGFRCDAPRQEGLAL